MKMNIPQNPEELNQVLSQNEKLLNAEITPQWGSLECMDEVSDELSDYFSDEMHISGLVEIWDFGITGNVLTIDYSTFDYMSTTSYEVSVDKENNKILVKNISGFNLK